MLERGKKGNEKIKRGNIKSRLFGLRLKVAHDNTGFFFKMFLASAGFGAADGGIGVELN